MAEPAAVSSHQLFKQWRSGDAEAGKAMAQRFSDWYYAITTARLGDEKGRGPLRARMRRVPAGHRRVAQGEPALDWAHDIVAKEVDAAGRRNTGGDFPNALHEEPVAHEPRPHGSGQARRGTDRAAPEGVQRLANADTIANLAAKSGGFPGAGLPGRHALAQALQSEAGIEFTTSPIPRTSTGARCPLYEAGKLASPCRGARVRALDAPGPDRLPRDR
jgi:hypothetical protein